MNDLSEKVKASIERLKGFEGVAMRHSGEEEEGYYLAFSGGKDSVVIKALAEMAGVPYTAHYRLTSVDPPELVHFIKEKYPDVKIDLPRYKVGAEAGKRITMWNLIVKKKYPPTRLSRYCCEFLKEDGGDGRMCITGVRWAESANRRQNQGLVTVYDGRAEKTVGDNKDWMRTRKGGLVLVNDNEEARQVVDNCVSRHKTTLNIIVDWTDRDVWDFIHAEGIPYCGLYDEGFSRIGCIGCPMAGRKTQEKEFYRWPAYKRAYIRAFAKMLESREAAGLSGGSWETGRDVFNWWMRYDELPGQMDLLEEDNE